MWSNIFLTITVVTLGTWFVLTCLSAFPLKRRLCGRSEFLSKVVPTWSFFAPNPGSYDFRLLSRDELVDGTITAWRELRIYSDSRPLMAAVWNPGQRRKKALFDIAQELSVGASAWDDPEMVKLSVPYLLLLTYVSSSAFSALSRRRQFVLVTASRRCDPTVLFVSEMHDLEGDESEALVHGKWERV